MQDTQSTIRELDVHIITDAVRQMCIDANHTLSADMRDSLQKALETEKSKLGRKVLEQLELNLKIAGQDRIPICQDTGMAVVFMEVGQDVHLCGGDLTEAVNEGVRQGYVNGYLRKSVVSDPLLRKNTGIIRRQFCMSALYREQRSALQSRRKALAAKTKAGFLC